MTLCFFLKQGSRRENSQNFSLVLILRGGNEGRLVTIIPWSLGFPINSSRHVSSTVRASGSFVVNVDGTLMSKRLLVTKMLKTLLPNSKEFLQVHLSSLPTN